MTSHGRGALILVGALVLGACQSEVPAANVSVTDSADVRIVESHAPAWGDSSRWSVSMTPSLNLSTSGAGPSHEFYMVNGALRLADGQVVVANDGSSEVRFYSPEGEFIRAVGRNGDGPGEFRRLRSLSRMRGDSVAVFDVLLNRVTILPPQDGVARIISLTGSFDRARQLRAYDDSTFIALATSYSGLPESGRYRVPYTVVLLDDAGSIRDTLAVIGGSEGYRNSGADGTLPFGKRGHFATWGSEFILGAADSLAFDRYRSPSVLGQRVRVPGYDLRLSAEQIDSTRQARQPPTDRPVPESILKLIETMPIPDFKPGYSRLLLDSDGYVWAARYYRRMQPHDVVEWEVFSPAGEWLGNVPTPAGFSVFEIGSDYMLGVLKDEMEVEHVQVRRLLRSE